MSDANPFLSPGCPIKPLGIIKTEGISMGGAEIIVISALQQPTKLSLEKVGKNHLIFLCGGTEWLESTFPQSGPHGFDFSQPQASSALITACCSLGVVTLNWGRLFDANNEIIWPLPSESTAP
ncbi:hypothetical protein [Novosphingobium capsulatum]|uniref:hypothetical protein n=1 Tax=Novosphingobium capsulatum TaxID=13688 RepID=UPI002E0E1114|nr:hypothetical protein U0041_03915 [Novosphingobium capsulatum]